MRNRIQKVNNPTIVGIATPLSSEGAIGIIRLSGPEALELASKVFCSKSGKQLNQMDSRLMHYGHIIYEDKNYDEVMCVCFKGPKSYTTEDVVEFHCHGNSQQLILLNSLFVKLGAEPASRGEFTKRAFLGGRIDLSQAEAIMDMISAKSSRSFDLALKQLGGRLYKKCAEISEELTDLMARIEVCIDYPDEDIELIEVAEIRTKLEELVERIALILKDADRGSIVRDGINVAIVGIPNVGKSSLMNFMLNEDRAIVTDIPGTTRDILREWVQIAGLPVHLIDTAGIRQTEDVVEKIGVERSKEMFNEADIVIIVLAKDMELSEDERELLELADARKAIILINKSDLEPRLSLEEVRSHNETAVLCEVSVKTSRGLDHFVKEFEKLALGSQGAERGEILLNSRQYSALDKARTSLLSALKAINDGYAIDLIEIDLIAAFDSIGEITGASVGEDVVNRIFEKFCLGK